jgi:hypothetical protein
MEAYMKVWILIAVSLMVFACSKEPEKTELMRHFEDAQQETKTIVEKANDILDNKIGNAPLENLAQLVYAKEVADAAKNVFKREQIFGFDQPEVDVLFDKLHRYDAELAPKAISLMHQMAQKTIDLRKRINDIKSQPFSVGKNTGTDNMVDFLGSQYNKDIRDCCLDDLYRINTILRASPEERYHPISQAINRAIDDLTNVLKDESGGQKYKQELNKLTQNITS